MRYALNTVYRLSQSEVSPARTPSLRTYHKRQVFKFQVYVQYPYMAFQEGKRRRSAAAANQVLLTAEYNKRSTLGALPHLESRAPPHLPLKIRWI